MSVLAAPSLEVNSFHESTPSPSTFPCPLRLESAIEEFDGTVVFVSHDRYFLDRIADRIVEVRDGEANAYEGGWSYWRERTGANRPAVAAS